ncbi:MFS transporter [Citricoccus sp. GCM10030269]|uniref:MFS transporter n=1 Tax=Citricoccus sp. GCM10030269 TaxID=3273388 RepID=UPI00361E3E4E
MSGAPETVAPGARRGLLDGKKRVLASAVAGTTVEWYDFYLYGMAAALVFNVQYFPGYTELGATLASFATLAVGVIMRPLGGVIAGHLGDRLGRKALLVGSLLLMGVASTLIGMLPTFDQIGWWAVAGLLLLRCLQGISAGAEWGGAALLSVEHAPDHRRGFFGSFTQVGSSAGMLLATGAFALVQMTTTDEQFAEYGWRLPFLASAVLVVIGLVIRLGVEDSQEFREHRTSGTVASWPVAEVLRHHWRPVLVTAGLRLAQNGVYYLITVYLLSYLVSTRGDQESAVTAVMIASAIGLFTTPFWGWMSDRYGRRTVSVCGYIAIGLSGWLVFGSVEMGALALLPLVVILIINGAHDSVYGPQAAWFAEQFPVRVRYSGVNLGYQVGTVIGGGFAPFIAALLFSLGGDTPWLIAAYLSLLAVASVTASLFARDPARDRRGASLADATTTIPGGGAGADSRTLATVGAANEYATANDTAANDPAANDTAADRTPADERTGR